MNTKERFLNALTQKPVDRPPVAAVVTGITVPMMEKANIFWPERADWYEAGVARDETIAELFTFVCGTELFGCCCGHIG